MAWNAITDAEIAVKKPITHALWQKVKDCLLYLYGMVAMVGTGGAVIRNGSFETDADSDGIPDGWSRGLYPGGSGAFETTSPAHGAQSYKFVHPGGASNGGGYLESDYVDIHALTAYAMTFISWASAAGMKNMVQARYFDKAKVELGAGSPVTLWTSTSNPASATENTVGFTPPAAAKYLKFKLIGGYTDTNVAGAAYFDNVTIMPVLSQNHLKTTTGTVTSTAVTNDVLVTLPGGEYAFMPQFKSNNITYVNSHGATFFSAQTLTDSYVTCLQLSSNAQGTFTAKSRYVTASGAEHWAFILTDRLTERILSVWESPDHPCYGQGGDPAALPHPFIEYIGKSLPEGIEIVLLDMESIRTLQATGKGFTEALNDYDLGESLEFVPRDMDGKRTLSELPADVTVRRIVAKADASETVVAARLEADRAARIEQFKAQVQAYIATKMPDWRLNRWKSYHQYAKRVESGSISALDAYELAEYNSFLDPGETHEQCAQYVPVALNWVVDCVVAHGAAAQAVFAATTDEELQAVQQTLPEWPLW